MQIDNMEDTLELLNNINYFFRNIDEVDKKLQLDLYNKEGERDDLLHEIELSKLSIGERSRIYSHLEKVLKERRTLKNKLELISTLKPYTNRYIMKGIFAETDTVIKNIQTLKSNQENRQYTPRILQDLKCAKKKKEENKNDK